MNRKENRSSKTDMSTKQVCEESLAHDKFVMEAVIAFALLKETKLMDAFTNRC